MFWHAKSKSNLCITIRDASLPNSSFFLVFSPSLNNYEILDLVLGMTAFTRLSRLEGIIPALETSHALAYLEKLCPTLPNGTKVVLNCSGRGDKDVNTAIKYLKF